MEIKQQLTTAVEDELQALDLQVLPAMQEKKNTGKKPGKSSDDCTKGFRILL